MMEWMTAGGLDDLLKAAEQDDRVLAILLYGSQARGESRPESDTDVCLVLSLLILRKSFTR